MACGPITSWQIDGETMETVYRLYFGGAPKSLQMVIAAMKLKDACSLEGKLWQVRQHIKKQRHYFANKCPSSQSYGSSSSHYGCERWTIKKAECRRIDAFELWCWTRLLRIPWTARRSNKSILKEISPNSHCKNWCWSWNSNTLAKWWKERTDQKRPWCWARWGQGEKGTTEVEMVGWHYQLYGHEFE